MNPNKPGPKKRTDAVAIPGGSNPLSKAIALRLKLIREERGLNCYAAAKQCGLVTTRWELFENEKAIPDSLEIERICRWAFEGISFSAYPLSKERRHRRISKGDGWKTHKFNVPKETDIRLVRTAKRLGISISALTQIAVEQFLGGEHVLSTYAEAVRRVKKARTVDRVNQDPYLASFLSGDLDIAVSMGAKLREPPKKETRQAPAEQLLEKFNAKTDDDWEILS